MSQDFSHIPWIPVDIEACAFRALVGEIHDDVLSIYIVYYEEKKEVHLRWYFYRKIIDYDRVCAKNVSDKILNLCRNRVSSVKTDLLVADKPQGKLDHLQSTIFSRRTYDGFYW